MTIRQKLQKLWDRTLMIKGRTVKLVPLMILLMIVTGASAALILHYTLTVDTTGEVVLNPYYIKLTDMADAEVGIVPFGQVMQGYGQWTDEFKLVLVNPAQEVHVAFRIAGSLATGVIVQCYDNTTGTPVEWQEGESFVKIMGDGNPTVLILAFMVSTDYSAIAGSIGDFDLVWDAYENYVNPFTANVDPITVNTYNFNDGGLSITSFIWADQVIPGGTEVFWDNGFTPPTTAPYAKLNPHASPAFFTWTGVPTGVTVHVYYWNGAGWTEIPQGTSLDLTTSQYLRFGIMADSSVDLPSLTLALNIHS